MTVVAMLQKITVIQMLLWKLMLLMKLSLIWMLSYTPVCSRNYDHFTYILSAQTNNLPLPTGSWKSCQQKTDLLITLGGDGTILHATSMLSHGPVPPVLSFSLGTLGFLLPFGT